MTWKNLIELVLENKYIFLASTIYTVYKIRHWKFRKDPEHPEIYMDNVKGGLDTAEYKTKKQILRQYPNEDFRTERWEDNKSKYWIIRVINMWYEDSFTPIEKEKDK